MSRRLSEIFAQTKSANRAALIGYLPAGFPTPDASVELMNAMIGAGVDAIEVGLPYSDPLMDGADIQFAVDAALTAGTTTDVVLDVVRRLDGERAAILVMSYWNPIERYGVERFAVALAAAGGNGVITPDLTPEEAGPWLAATKANEIDRIFLVAPSSTDDRIVTVVKNTSGFVYAASTMGVTGARSQVGSGAQGLVARTRLATDLPIAVGLGVSTGAQAHEVAAYSDGVIVGSAFVRCIRQAVDLPSAVAAVRALAGDLAEGVRR
jgi:tryptophan synthase alpha chain